MDLVSLFIGAVIGVAVRFREEEMIQYVFGHADGWLLLFGSVLLANYLTGAYRLQYTFSRFNLVVTWAFSLTFCLLILSTTSYTWFRHVLGRGVLFLSIAVYSVMSLFLKLLVYRGLFRRRLFVCRTAFLGLGPRVESLRRMIENEFVLPAHKVVACIRLSDVDASDDGGGNRLDGIAIIDSDRDNFEDVVRGLDVSLVIIAADELVARPDLYPHFRRLRFEGVEVLPPLTVAEIYSGRLPVDLVSEERLMEGSAESAWPMVWRIKRLLDLFVSLVASVVLAPVALLVAAAVKLSALRSPVFYTQMRVGQFGRPFRIYKFRTMREGAEEETGPVWAEENDPRITRLGRVLRRFRLDEIPQFVNILKGEMSLVGPRPERPEIVAELEKGIPYYSERHNIMPGLTGWAQVRHPYTSTVSDSVRKLEYDLYYMTHLSVALDLQIILSSLRIVVLGKERSV